MEPVLVIAFAAERLSGMSFVTNVTESLNLCATVMALHPESKPLLFG